MMKSAMETTETCDTKDGKSVDGLNFKTSLGRGTGGLDKESVVLGKNARVK